MTPERARLLEAVAEAAKAWQWAYSADDYHEEGGDQRLALDAAVDALRAHDAAPPVVGETVEVRAKVYLSNPAGRLIVMGEHLASGLPHIATITARVPLPVVPVIVATVEEVKR